uniref:Uncharacterized protein n=1 Tax=Branchiostoma floridae TaxID=7739 RepID=C3ZRR7_BRAFL|eukprot:XP_002588856.1 hypothetical protein BRAFLDRAFT_99568 [Branchiostoma floridae]
MEALSISAASWRPSPSLLHHGGPLHLCCIMAALSISAASWRPSPSLLHHGGPLHLCCIMEALSISAAPLVSSPFRRSSGEVISIMSSLPVAMATREKASSSPAHPPINIWSHGNMMQSSHGCHGDQLLHERAGGNLR